MENDRLSSEFAKSLFEKKKELQIIECIFEGLDEYKIIEKLIQSKEENENNDRV